jgi:uncharacterized membrane protein YidH (DUF202 family)
LIVPTDLSPPTNSPPPPDDPPRTGDAGLAGERTELAWNRSGLAVLVCVSVLLRWIWPLNRTSARVALGLIAAGAVVWGLGLQAGRRTARLALRPKLTNQTARLLSLGTVALAAGAFVLGFFPPS